MKKIITGVGSYLIEQGLLDKTGELILSQTNAQRAMVVSDENVFRLYGERLLNALSEAGIIAESIVFPAGENSKCLQNFEKILFKLSEENFSRSDALIALGGGVIGDLGGFAASCFKRGMTLIQIPASLLAMVDSSLGGKTGVNLQRAKNQIGSFYEPVLTICDTDLLRSLPEREFKCGMGEIIKYAVLFDRELFYTLLRGNFDLSQVIEKCAQYKTSIVKEDKFDRGRRQLLNLGHTVGHAIEVLSDFEISHGESVTTGLCVITRAAVEKGICGKETLTELSEMLNKYGLTEYTGFSVNDVYDVVLKDKKISGNELTLIVPERIGKCQMIKIQLTQLKDFLKAGGLK